MEITFTRKLSTEEKEKVRQVVGFYRGIAIFKQEDVLQIRPKDDFLQEQFSVTLHSLDIPIKNVNVSL